MRLLFLAIAALLFAPQPTQAQGRVVLKENFSGTELNSAIWIKRDGCPHEVGVDNTCFNPANVLVGGGYLHLKLTQGTLGRKYDGASIATCQHGYGWPCKNILRQFRPPVRFEARIKYAAVGGLWQNFWAVGTDRAEPSELDIAEVRGALPKTLTCHVHITNTDPHKHYNMKIQLPFNFSKGFHKYWMKYPNRDTVSFGTYWHGVPLLCGKHKVTNINAIAPIFEAKTSTNYGALGGPPKTPSQFQVDWFKVIKP